MVLRQESTLTKALGTPTPPSLKVTAPARQVGSRVAVSVACTRFGVPPVTRIARLTAHIMPAHNHYAGSLGSAMAVITATRSMTRNAAAYDLCGDRRVRLLQWGIPDPVQEVQLWGCAAFGYGPQLRRQSSTTSIAYRNGRCVGWLPVLVSSKIVHFTSYPFSCQRGLFSLLVSPPFRSQTLPPSPNA
jgi:hypothetical protein